MSRVWLAGMVLVPGIAAAQVPPESTACFARALTAAELAEPGAEVAELLVVIDTHAGGRPAEAEILVRAIPRAQFGAVLFNDGGCGWEAATASYDCAMACAGGRVSVEMTGEGAVFRAGRAFSLSDACAASGRRVTASPGEGPPGGWRLVRLPDAACPPADPWTAVGAPR